MTAAAARVAPQPGAVALAQELVRIPSVTAVTPDLRAPNAAALDVLERFLTAHGATCTRLPYEGGHAKWGYPVDNLYAEWRWGTPRTHLCFMGHTDVVPPGDAALWTASPFSGHVADGWLWGRGATDMKGAVAAFASAAAQAAQAPFKDAALSLLITADEEWAAVNGSRKVLGWMKDTGRTPTAVLVGEPSSQDTFGTHIKAGRRGSLCGTLEVTGVQGHAAYPGLFDNPNRALMLALSILNTHRWADATPDTPATNFEVIALSSGDFGATAVVPGQARALWNVRHTPAHTAAQIAATLDGLLKHPPAWAHQHPDAPRLAKVKLVANLDTASRPYRSAPGAFAHTVADAVQAVLGTRPVFDGAGGTTDGRFVHDFFPDAEIVELGVPERGGAAPGPRPADYGTKGGMHQVDERVRVADLEHVEQCYARTIAAVLGAP